MERIRKFRNDRREVYETLRETFADTTTSAEIVFRETVQAQYLSEESYRDDLFEEGECRDEHIS